MSHLLNALKLLNCCQPQLRIANRPACKPYIMSLFQKELGIQINKFETIIDRDTSETNQEELIRNAYYVIKSFGEVDNNFKGLFVNLHQRIKDYLFISEAELCKKYRIREGNTYKKSIKIVDRLNEETIKEKNELILFLEGKLATIE